MAASVEVAAGEGNGSVEDLDRVLAALYSLLDESDRLGLSRAARLRIVAIIGDLEAFVRSRVLSPGGGPEATRE